MKSSGTSDVAACGQGEDRSELNVAETDNSRSDMIGPTKMIHAPHTIGRNRSQRSDRSRNLDVTDSIDLEVETADDMFVDRPL